MDEANRLQHVGNVIQSADLGLEELLVEDFAVRNLLGRFLEAKHVFPGHEQLDELLAEVAQRFNFLVLGLLLLGPARCGAALAARLLLRGPGRGSVL